MSITLILIIVSSLISYQAFQRPEMLRMLQHHPYTEHNQREYFRWLTAGFVHGSWMHLLINMFVLYQFGEFVEYQFIGIFGETMGRINYLALYLLTIIAANIPTYFVHRESPYFASVGASGAISGILFVFVLFKPWSMLLLFFIIPIPAIIAAVLYLVYSSWASKNQSDRIDHAAHFYGAVFGLLFALAIKPSLFSLFIDRLVHQFPF